jgi:hypothetical protein
VDDFVVNVRQIGQYPIATTTGPNDLLLLQQGGLAGPYVSITPINLVGTALRQEGTLQLSLGEAITWGNAAWWSDGASLNSNVPVNVPSLNSVGDIFVAGQALATQVNVDQLFDSIINNSVFTVNGRKGNVQLETDDILRAGAAPIQDAHFGGYCTAPTAWDFRTNSDQIATTAFVQMVIGQLVCGGSLVTSFNGRGGAITLTVDDVNAAYAAAIAPDWPTAPSPPLYDASARIATTMFVDESVQDLRDQLPAFIFNLVAGFDYAPINSPAFTGVPTAPTAAPGSSTGQLATTAFVHAAIVASTTGVASFNTRTGAVTLTGADLTAAGGALLASPVFTGTPQAPTATIGTDNTQIATTAFVQAATAGAGVSSFNGRGGAVTLTTADVTGAGGAPLASPTFTGVPAVPTATAGTNTTQAASTAFVAAAIAGFTGGVQSFNGRTGAVTLQGNDVSAAGGALLVSPALTGTPTAPTATTGTSTTQLATTAFVAAAIGAGGGVNSFNGRAGTVVFTAADLASVNGATYHQADAAPTFPSNTFWFDSLNGQLYVNYVDPVSSASSWIIANSQLNPQPPPLLIKHLSGLTLSNDTGSPQTTIDIATGAACSDDDSAMMVLTTAWTKNVIGQWTAGSGLGGLDTGAVNNNLWYHVFLIMRPDTGAVDVLFSLSATAPTMPANYTKKRRIGAIKTDASSHVLGFTQLGDQFLWGLDLAYDIYNGGQVAAAPGGLVTATVPLGVKTRAIVNVFNSTGATLNIMSPDSQPVFGSSNVYQATSSQLIIRTNTSSQIRVVASAAEGAGFYAGTVGWYDNRGK